MVSRRSGAGAVMARFGRPRCQVQALFKARLYLCLLTTNSSHITILSPSFVTLLILQVDETYLSYPFEPFCTSVIRQTHPWRHRRHYGASIAPIPANKISMASRKGLWARRLVCVDQKYPWQPWPWSIYAARDWPIQNRSISKLLRRW